MIPLVDAIPPVRAGAAARAAGRASTATAPTTRARGAATARAPHPGQDRLAEERARFRARQARWVVERTIAWLHQYRRLRIRYERRDDIHEAFLAIGCSLICLKLLQPKNSF